ncbi:carboxylate/amino acid/amine transporter [Ruegeria denitrificans]|uniref:Carboxylate/amino acid/amine transporter n=1 Tax=Ruegeria denitrificans TaxID=1715692 RepID=A0A0P1I7M6_9RHOB|nr:DMT family transporter [Ruegeria denitrificans]CUJ95603.1 carboxylate/amino acid/amine transporter [Ruegeria denitrificans]
MRGVLLVALGMLVSSTIGVGVRAVDAATSWQILVYRSIGTILFLAMVIAIRQQDGMRGVLTKIDPPVLVGGIGLMLASCGVIVAFEHTTVANAFFLVAAAPFIAALLGRALLSEQVRKATWFAIVLGLGGVAIMVGGGLSIGQFWGNIAGLIAAFGFAIFAVSLRWGRSNDLLVLALAGGCFTFLTASFATLMSGTGFSVSMHDLLISLAMGAFQLGCALLLITAGSRSVPAAEIAVLGLVEIVLAPVWVWIIFGENVGLMTVLGGTTVLLAVVIDAITGARKAHAM